MRSSIRKTVKIAHDQGAQLHERGVPQKWVWKPGAATWLATSSVRAGGMPIMS
jgi:hypothetical protein